jgi:hypothetical protein
MDIKWKSVEDFGAEVTWLHGHGRRDFPSPGVKAWLPPYIPSVEWCRTYYYAPKAYLSLILLIS